MTDHSDLIERLRERISRRQADFEKQATRGWHSSVEEAASFATMTVDYNDVVALLETTSSQSLSLSEARAENERLRAALAQSDLPCAYCSLPKDEWAKCASGFPGCDRADDAMGCPELGARLSIESATRQRDEALAALNASEEALKPFVTEFDERREAYIRRYPRNLGVGAANFDAMPDEWKMENSTFTMGQYRRARSVLENSKTRLADATNNPSLSSLRKGAEVPCPHAPTYDAGLCCGHPDDCTFVSPSALVSGSREDGA